MQSISSIIQKVQIDLNQLQDAKLNDISQNLIKTSSALDNISEKKISILDDRNQTQSSKKKLMLQVRANKLDGYICKLKSKIKINLQGLQNNSQIKNDTKKQIVNILKEIDSSKSDILSNSAGDNNVALPSSKNLGFAMQAAIEGKNNAKQNQIQSQNSKANREQTLYEKSSSLLQTQLKVIKKSKFFKTFFQIISPMIRIGGKSLASLCSGGVASILVSNAFSTGFEMLQSVIVEGLNTKLKNAKTSEKEIQDTIKNNEKAMQQLLKNSKNNELAFANAAKTFTNTQQSA